MLENRLMDLCNSIYGGTPDDIALDLTLLLSDLSEDDLGNVVYSAKIHLQLAKNNASK